MRTHCCWCCLLPYQYISSISTERRNEGSLETTLCSMNSSIPFYDSIFNDSTFYSILWFYILWFNILCSMILHSPFYDSTFYVLNHYSEHNFHSNIFPCCLRTPVVKYSDNKIINLHCYRSLTCNLL